MTDYLDPPRQRELARQFHDDLRQLEVEFSKLGPRDRELFIEFLEAMGRIEERFEERFGARRGSVVPFRPG